MGKAQLRQIVGDHPLRTRNIKSLLDNPDQIDTTRSFSAHYQNSPLALVGILEICNHDVSLHNGNPTIR